MGHLEQIVDELKEISDPWKQLERAAALVPDKKISLGTSGQLTGTAILEGAFQNSIPLRIYTVNTLRLFPESIDYFNLLEQHYNISIEYIHPDSKELDDMVAKHGAFLFFDSKGKQEYCCEIRKVRPNYAALSTTDIWVTGLRHDQSAFRKDTPAVQIVDIPDLAAGETGITRQIIKLAPLINWTEQEVRHFLEQANAPIHPLLGESDSEWFFESLGCVICTTRQAKWEPPRSGRWRWFNEEDPEKKECGIHLPPPTHLNSRL